MDIKPTEIDGVFTIHMPAFTDERGVFQKLYRRDLFKAAGIDWQIREEFVSVSGQGVLRGMHFQRPPHAHHKLVSCFQGKVLDVLLDMRRASATFGQTISFELGGEVKGVVVPVGMAHGFYSMEGNSMVHYQTSAEYAPDFDAGIRWDSFGFEWPDPASSLSERDQVHPGWDPQQTEF